MMQSLYLFQCQRSLVCSHIRLNSTSVQSSIISRIRYVLNHYWLGSKLLYRNSQLVRKISKKDVQQLTRVENSILKQFHYDIRVGIPFVTLFALPIIGYTAPLLALLAPKYLPSTLIMPKQKIQFLKDDVHASLSLIDSLDQISNQHFNAEQINGMIPSMQFIYQVLNSHHRFNLIKDSIPEYSSLFEKTFSLSLLPRQHLLLFHRSVLHSSFIAKYCLNNYSLEKQLDLWEYEIFNDDKQIRDIDQLNPYLLVKSLYDRGLYLHVDQMGQVLQFEQTKNLNPTDKKFSKFNEQLSLDEQILNDWRLLLKQWIDIHQLIYKSNPVSTSFLLHVSPLLTAGK